MSSRRRGVGGVAAIAGQVIGQLSLVLVMPVLTRQFDPSELGPYQIATAIAVILQPIATLRVEFVIPAAGQHGSARSLWSRAMLWMAGLSLLLILAAGVTIAVGWPGASTLAMTALLLAGFSWTLIDNAMLVRRGSLTRLGARNAIAGVLAASLQVAATIANLDVISLAAAILVARGVAIISTAHRRALGEDEGIGFGEEAAEDYGVARMMSSVSSGVLAVGANQALTLFAGWGYGSAAGGIVGTAQRVAGVPLSVLGQGIGQVTQARTGAVIRGRLPHLGAALHRQLLMTGALALGSAISLIVLGPMLAGPVLGDEWADAGIVIAILAIPLSMQLVVGPVMPVLAMLTRERVLLALQTARLALVIVGATGCLLVGADILVLCTVVGVATVAGYAAMLIATLLIVRGRDARFDV